LEYATVGDIHNLIINMPPRHGKSILVSVLWFTWVWTFKPESRWLYSSYAANLAIRDSVKCRRLIQSYWYQETFGDVFSLTADQNQKIRFENDKTGYRIASSVTGAGTGEGGNYLCSDDPINAADAMSPVKRDKANTWWDDTMSSRGNNPEGTVRVVVMQRLHENELTGHLLDKMADGGTSYELLCLPAEYEPNRCMLSTGWQDPRTEIGELLWPQRFSQVSIDRLKSELNDPAGQLQQRPSPAGGGIFQKSWWDGKNRYHTGEGRCVGRYISIDTAFKDKSKNDPSAACVFELWADYRVTVRWMWEKRIVSAFLPQHIEAMAEQWNEDGELRAIVIEDKGSGTTVAQTLRMSAQKWISDLIVDFMPSGSKEQRAQLAAIWCGRDCVLLPHPDDDNADWYTKFLDPQRGQLWVFPNATHDDMTDSFVMGIQYLENLIAAGWDARRQNIVRTKL